MTRVIKTLALALTTVTAASPAAAAINFRLETRDFSIASRFLSVESDLRDASDSVLEYYSRVGPMEVSALTFDGFDRRLGRLQQVTVSILSSQTVAGTLQVFASETTANGTVSKISAADSPGFRSKVLLNGTVIDSASFSLAGERVFFITCNQVIATACTNGSDFTEAFTSNNAVADLMQFTRGAFTVDLQREGLNSGSVLRQGRTTLQNETRLSWSGSVIVGYVSDDALAAIPEPQSWALMIAGFGMIGGALRRRATGINSSVRPAPARLPAGR